MRTLRYLVARSERAISVVTDPAEKVRPDDMSIYSASSYSSRFLPLRRRCSNSFNRLLIAAIFDHVITRPSLIMLSLEFGELGDASTLLMGIERKLCDC